MDYKVTVVHYNGHFFKNTQIVLLRQHLKQLLFYTKYTKLVHIFHFLYLKFYF